MSKYPGKEIGFIPPTTPRERELARRAVAAHALDPTDAVQQMMERLIHEWLVCREVVKMLEADLNPPITDSQGRVWTWWKDDLYRHENKAWPKGMIVDE